MPVNQVIVTNASNVTVGITPQPCVQVQISRTAYTQLAGVNKISAGTNITVTPSSGVGNVLISASGNLVSDKIANANTIVQTYYNGNVTITGNNYTSTFDTNGSLTVPNVITANYLVGNGSNINNISAANIVGIVANSNFSAYSGIASSANSVAGANVSGQVANANYSLYANYSYHVDGSNVNGYVPNAVHANVANIANSVQVSNVVGLGNIALINLDGNSGNILYGNGIFAQAPNTYYSNIANYANFAGTAFSVNGSNVVGIVGNATHANVSDVSNSVAGANVTGTVANASHATIADSANSVSGSNVSGAVNLANYATVANSVAGSNVSGIVANANYAAYAGNISGTVANANYAAYAGIASTANSIAGANVSGQVQYAAIANSVTGANVLGQVQYAAVANSVAAANISGVINLANYATVANSVAGANVSGIVANANYAAYAGNANIANTANAVAGANVSGIVANANFASYSNLASYANVLIGNSIANANYSNFAGELVNGNSNVTIPSQDGNVVINANGGTDQQWVFDNTGNLTLPGSSYIKPVTGSLNLTDNTGNSYIDIDTNNIYFYTDYEGSEYEWNLDNTGNTNIPNNIMMGGGLIRDVNGVSLELSSSNRVSLNHGDVDFVTASSSGVDLITREGNVTIQTNYNTHTWTFDEQGNTYLPNNVSFVSANIDNNYNINSPGYYFIDINYNASVNQNTNYNPNTPGFTIFADSTIGSNVLTNVSVYDYYGIDPIDFASVANYILNQGIAFTGVLNNQSLLDNVIDAQVVITNVDVANNAITLSGNAKNTQSQLYYNTGTWLVNNATYTNFLMSPGYIVNATNTNSANNTITLANMDMVGAIGLNPYQYFPVQFVGTSFGNISNTELYYTGNIDYANNTITICSTIGGGDVTLTTDSGNLSMVFALPAGGTVIPVILTNGQYNQFGPWATNPPNINDFTNIPNVGLVGNITFNQLDYNQPYDYNANGTLFNDATGQFSRFTGSMLITDNGEGYPTSGGKQFDAPSLGVSILHSGLNSNIAGYRVNQSILNFTDNSTDQANILNPRSAPAFSFVTAEGNINSPLTDYAIKQGRVLGRVIWNGYQNINNNQSWLNTSGAPVAGIYVQATGDWDDNVNQNMPMAFSLQYSPLNATPSVGSVTYASMPRTFLQASNNDTYLGGASSIQFKPLPYIGGGLGQKSITALGNSSITLQTFATISGYTQGNALATGSGSLLSINTNDSTWNGDVALRFDRTVGNTANIEFKLPQNSANTLLIVDNNSGRTAATVQNGFLNMPSYAAATLRTLTGVAGSLASVSDNSNKLAYWNGSGWYYVKDDSAV